jgi:hypothetical protein
LLILLMFLTLIFFNEINNLELDRSADRAIMYTYTKETKQRMLMKFNIFQFKISSEAADRINEVGFDGDLGKFAMEAKITRDVGCFGSDRWEPEMAAKFNLVAECEASNLEDVFHMGNGYGDQSKFTKLGNMHSLSVGDLVECVDTGDVLMVDPMGWTAVSYQGLRWVA